jgi:hypothetical protein
MVTAYRDREQARWYRLDPEEPMCLDCALPRRLQGQAVCVAATVAHGFEPRGLATARPPLDMMHVVESRQVAQRQLRWVSLDGTMQTYWELLT